MRLQGNAIISIIRPMRRKREYNSKLFVRLVLLEAFRHQFDLGQIEKLGAESTDLDHIGVDIDSYRRTPGAESRIERHKAAIAADIENAISRLDQIGQLVAVEPLFRRPLAIDRKNAQRLIG